MNEPTPDSPNRNRGQAGQTPQRQIRIADDVYYAAVQKAKAEGTTLAQVVASALREYVSASA